MAIITLKGNEIETVGNLPKKNTTAPDFTVTARDLSDINLHDFAGKNVVLNIFASLDTAVCAASVRRFNEEAGKMKDTIVLCISADLPFAHNRFCETEGLKNVINGSVFRSPAFGKAYGVTIKTGPMAGLLSRAVLVLDKNNTVVYSEQVPEISQEPDYKKAISALNQL